MHTRHQAAVPQAALCPIGSALSSQLVDPQEVLHQVFSMDPVQANFKWKILDWEVSKWPDQAKAQYHNFVFDFNATCPLFHSSEPALDGPGQCCAHWAHWFSRPDWDWLSSKLYSHAYTGNYQYHASSASAPITFSNSAMMSGSTSSFFWVASRISTKTWQH